MSETLVTTLVFYTLAVLAVAGAALVAFAPSIVHSAFALLGTFFGMAGLYALLSADLVAVIQVLVYVGGILVLILFAVMLTSRIDAIEVSNPATGRIPGLLLLAGVAAVLAVVAVGVFGSSGVLPPGEPTTAAIGNALLGEYVLPFEVVSILLLAALVGAVTLARGKPGEDAR
jgi:NADH-quinone oxidoreductase subunit J